MKKFIFILSVFFALTAFTVLNTHWKIDPPNSQLSFTVNHLGINHVTGFFHDFDVAIQSAKPDFSDAVVTLQAKTASIDTRVDARDNHLKSADFFDAEKFPEISFKSTSLKATGDNHYELTGDLTMHGITKKVTLDMEHVGTVQNPMNKKPTAGIRITGTIKRSDFNIGEKFPNAVISDEVTIKGDGEFVQ